MKKYYLAKNRMPIVANEFNTIDAADAALKAAQTADTENEYMVCELVDGKYVQVIPPVVEATPEVPQQTTNEVQEVTKAYINNKAKIDELKEQRDEIAKQIKEIEAECELQKQIIVADFTKSGVSRAIESTTGTLIEQKVSSTFPSRDKAVVEEFKSNKELSDFVTYRETASIDVKKLKEDRPDLYNKYLETSEVIKISSLAEVK